MLSLSHVLWSCSTLCTALQRFSGLGENYGAEARANLHFYFKNCLEFILNATELFFLLYRFIESFLLCCLCFLKKWQIYSKASIIGGMTQSVWERDVCGFRGTKLDMQAGWEVVSQSPFDTNVQYKAFLSHRNSSSTELHSQTSHVTPHWKSRLWCLAKPQSFFVSVTLFKINIHKL